MRVSLDLQYACCGSKCVKCIASVLGYCVIVLYMFFEGAHSVEGKLKNCRCFVVWDGLMGVLFRVKCRWVLYSLLQGVIKVIDDLLVETISLFVCSLTSRVGVACIEEGQRLWGGGGCIGW